MLARSHRLRHAAVAVVLPAAGCAGGTGLALVDHGVAGMFGAALAILATAAICWWAIVVLLPRDGDR